MLFKKKFLNDLEKTTNKNTKKIFDALEGVLKIHKVTPRDVKFDPIGFLITSGCTFDSAIMIVCFIMQVPILEKDIYPLFTRKYTQRKKVDDAEAD